MSLYMLLTGISPALFKTMDDDSCDTYRRVTCFLPISLKGLGHVEKPTQRDIVRYMNSQYQQEKDQSTLCHSGFKLGRGKEKTWY